MSKKIRILYTIPNFDTAGSGKVVFDLVKGLDKSKFAPEIMVKHTKGAFFKEVKKLGVPIHVFDYETNYKPLWSFPFRILGVVRFFKKNNWDIIHSWHWSSDFSEALAARLTGIKYIYTKKNMSWGNKAWKIKSKLSSHIITINTSMKNLFFNKMDKVSYIPVGIDINYFKKSPRKESIDGIDLKDKFVIISVANMVPVKGIEILIEAFKNLDEQTEKNIELLLVGSYHGEYGQKLIELSEHKSNIHLLGKKNDVRPYITEADVFVIPTLNIGRKEAQGVAPLEAMSMHVPVLASDLDGLRDVMINHKDNLFESGNVEELLKKLLKLYEVKTVPNKIEEHFRLDSMNKSYNELYESIYF